MRASGRSTMIRSSADVLSKMIALKARWSEQALREHTGIQETLVVLNEPYLASLGSSVVPVDRETVRAGWEDISSMVEGGLGIHCCSNTDWEFVIGLNPAVISLDAYTTAKEFLLYADSVIGYMERGGVVAWGIVPADYKLFSTETWIRCTRSISQSGPSSPHGCRRNFSMHSP